MKANNEIISVINSIRTGFIVSIEEINSNASTAMLAAENTMNAAIEAAKSVYQAEIDTINKKTEASLQSIDCRKAVFDMKLSQYEAAMSEKEAAEDELSKATNAYKLAASAVDDLRDVMPEDVIKGMEAGLLPLEERYKVADAHLTAIETVEEEFEEYLNSFADKENPPTQEELNWLDGKTPAMMPAKNMVDEVLQKHKITLPVAATAIRNHEFLTWSFRDSDGNIYIPDNSIREFTNAGELPNGGFLQEGEVYLITAGKLNKDDIKGVRHNYVTALEVVDKKLAEAYKRMA